MLITRRKFLAAAAAAAAPAVPAWTAQDPPRSLLDLAATPIQIEFPGQPSRPLPPGAAQRALDGQWAAFPKAGPLAIRQVVRELAPGLLERSIEVLADTDTAFNIELTYDFPAADSFYSWHNKETARLALVQDVDERGKPLGGGATQLLPFAGAVENGMPRFIMPDISSSVAASWRSPQGLSSGNPSA